MVGLVGDNQVLGSGEAGDERRGWPDIRWGKAGRRAAEPGRPGPARGRGGAGGDRRAGGRRRLRSRGAGRRRRPPPGDRGGRPGRGSRWSRSSGSLAPGAVGWARDGPSSRTRWRSRSRVGEGTQLGFEVRQGWTRRDFRPGEGIFHAPRGPRSGGCPPSPGVMFHVERLQLGDPSIGSIRLLSDKLESRRATRVSARVPRQKTVPPGATRRSPRANHSAGGQHRSRGRHVKRTALAGRAAPIRRCSTVTRPPRPSSRTAVRRNATFLAVASTSVNGALATQAAPAGSPATRRPSRRQPPRSLTVPGAPPAARRWRMHPEGVRRPAPTATWPPSD